MRLFQRYAFLCLHCFLSGGSCTCIVSFQGNGLRALIGLCLGKATPALDHDTVMSYSDIIYRHLMVKLLIAKLLIAANYGLIVFVFQNENPSEEPNYLCEVGAR